LPELNDPTDGRPRLAPQTDGELAEFLIRDVRRRKPYLSGAALAHEEAVIRYNIPRLGVETLQRRLSQILNVQLAGYRIYSLSKRHDNMSLWAKYAGDHSGYCLEFKNEGPFFALAFDVTYDESLLMDINNPEHTNGYWFFSKRPEWSNEEEVRVVMIRGCASTVPIDPSWLSRIILGWKMSEENRQQIRKWAKQRTPELAVVTASYDELQQKIRLL